MPHNPSTRYGQQTEMIMFECTCATFMNDMEPSKYYVAARGRSMIMLHIVIFTFGEGITFEEDIL